MSAADSSQLIGAGSMTTRTAPSESSPADTHSGSAVRLSAPAVAAKPIIFSIDSWKDFVVYAGGKEIDTNGDKTFDDKDIVAALKEKGIKFDPKKGLTYEAAKALNEIYGLNITRAAFELLSLGGSTYAIRSGGDDTITIEDLQKFVADVLNDITKGTGQKEEALQRYLRANSFKIVNKKEAAKTFADKYATAGTITVKTILDHTKMTDITKQVISNILGIPVGELTDTAALSQAQVETLFLSLGFLGSIDKPGDFYGPAKDIPRLDSENLTTTNFLAWFTKGTDGAVTADATGATAKGGGAKGKEGGEITQEEAKEIQKLAQLGNKDALISYLEPLRDKYPTNLLLKDMLADNYEEKERYSDALKEAMDAYNGDKTAARKQKVISLAVRFNAWAQTRELDPKQRQLAVQVGSIIKAMSDDYQGDQKTSLLELSKSLQQLEFEKMPGEAAFLAELSKSDSKLIDIKKSYDEFATALEAAIVQEEAKATSADKVKLARMYAKMAEIELTRRNYNKVELYGKKLAKLYSDLPGQAQESAKESLRKVISELVQFRHSDRVKNAKEIILAMPDGLIKELSVPIDVRKKDKGKLVKETDKITIKSANELDRFISPRYTPDDTDIAKLYYDYVKANPSLPRAEKMGIALKAVYIYSVNANWKALGRKSSDTIEVRVNKLQEWWIN